MSLLKIHFFGSDPENNAVPLANVLGQGDREQSEGADARRYERLLVEAPKRWVVASEEEADLFVYCHSYEENETTKQGALRAKELGKPCLFFHMIDETAPTALPYGVVYRESFLASLQRDDEEALPALSDDLAREVGGFQPNDKTDKPTVGFCGFVGSSWRRTLFRMQGRQRKVLGLDFRNEALKLLDRSSRVEANFIRRTQFWGGAISRFRGPDPDAKRRVREEYLANLSESDYTLCVRGAGNFSYRFYETLAMGRIPLFVNTDCRLPFDDQIDWQRHVVWVEQEELPKVADIVAEFHSALSNDQFVQLQKDNRKLWEDYLRPTECYEHVLNRVVAANAQ